MISLSAIRPVGQKVSLADAALPLPEFPAYHACWTQSGTAALALGITLAMQRSARGADGVILPAYGCPDLVAAVLYAGARPVLVDTSPDDPGYDLEALARRMGADIVAIVAVNFLGIQERNTELRTLAEAHGAWLIEDRAQSFPNGDAALAGDAVVLSFGRGKPVNLLGGGAILLRNESIREVDEELMAPFAASTLKRLRPGITERVALRMRATAFNFLARPIPYGLVSRIPGIGLGTTRYQPLPAVKGLDGVRLACLGVNVANWLGHERWRERAWEEALGRIGGIQLLPLRLRKRLERLLRYPILLPNRESCEAMRRSMVVRRLGASQFYGRPLPQIKDVPKVVAKQGPFPGAQAFAERLMVLPLHDEVRTKHIQEFSLRLASTLSRKQVCAS